MIAADTMEKFYEAFWWLHRHPLFEFKGKLKKFRQSSFPGNLEIETRKVDPTTRCIEDDKDRNTQVVVWLEVIVYEDGTDDDLLYDESRGIPTHYWKLDCGGDTFEEAIIELARLVREQEGDYDPAEREEAIIRLAQEMDTEGWYEPTSSSEEGQ